MRVNRITGVTEVDAALLLHEKSLEGAYSELVVTPEEIPLLILTLAAYAEKKGIRVPGSQTGHPAGQRVAASPADSTRPRA